MADKQAKGYRRAQALVPIGEISLDYVAAPGPGGQNVNKVATKAVLRWALTDSKAFSAEEKERLLGRLKNRINRAGELVLTESSSRSQQLNRERVLDKLNELVRRGLETPRVRKKTKVPRSSVEARLQAKRLRSMKKGARGRRREEA